jgi:predicted nucleic acid-binding Zn ribbon protein
MATDGPVRLGKVLEDVIERLGVQKKIDEARVVETWAAVAGPEVNGVTTSVWMKDATLFVKISSAAWRQELHMNRRKWKRRLNAEFDREVVDEIVFR